MDFYPLPNFSRRITLKDMIFLEILCQAQIISDLEAEAYVDCVNKGTSFVSLLLNNGFSHTELILGRKLVAELLQDNETLEQCVAQAKAQCKRVEIQKTQVA